MPKCENEKCPREVEDGQKLCRYHLAERQAGRADRVQKVLDNGDKIFYGLLLAISHFAKGGRGRPR